jgi:flagellar hook-associated protein 3 FlgL
MTGVGRISTYNIHQSLLRDTTRTQVGLYDLQGQLSSGLKTQSFSGLGSDVEKFIELEARMGRSKTYIDTATVISDRLTAMDNVLGQVIDTATSIKNLIALRRNAAVGDDLAYQTQLEGQWKTLVTQMNSSSEGRYLFSGTRTDVPAVDADNFPTLQQDGVPDTGYYKGSADDVTVRLEDNFSITYNVRADEPAFQKIFAGLAMAQRFGNVSGENEGMKAAYDMLEEGVEEVISLRATVNANKVTVSDNKERLESLQLYWRGLKESISNTDIVSVSTEVAVNQGILQASFQAFARISSLKLSDFLR